METTVAADGEEDDEPNEGGHQLADRLHDEHCGHHASTRLAGGESSEVSLCSELWVYLPPVLRLEFGRLLDTYSAVMTALRGYSAPMPTPTKNRQNIIHERMDME